MAINLPKMACGCTCGRGNLKKKRKKGGTFAILSIQGMQLPMYNCISPGDPQSVQLENTATTPTNPTAILDQEAVKRAQCQCMRLS